MKKLIGCIFIATILTVNPGCENLHNKIQNIRDENSHLSQIEIENLVADELAKSENDVEFYSAIAAAILAPLGLGGVALSYRRRMMAVIDALREVDDMEGTPNAIKQVKSNESKKTIRKELS